jgi:hypothetical protein
MKHLRHNLVVDASVLLRNFSKTVLSIWPRPRDFDMSILQLNKVYDNMQQTS